MKKAIWEWGKIIVVALVLAVVIRHFIFSPYKVEGASMSPTFKNGDSLIIKKIGFEPKDLKRFDVIIFHANEKDDYIKRIIGLPGDHIQYKNDELYINGKKSEESFLQDKTAEPKPFTEDFEMEGTVPADHFFVMGDNRPFSLDSRKIGFIPFEQVTGKVNFRIYPFDTMGTKF